MAPAKMEEERVEYDENVGRKYGKGFGHEKVHRLRSML
jgi:hypothetical protein